MATSAQTAPKKKRHILRYLALGILAIVILSVLFGGGDDDEASTPAASAPAEASASEAPVGLSQPVRDGDFEFTVTASDDCSQTTIGSQYLQETAQGKYCIIDVTVTNIGDEAQYFSGSDQKALDEAGREFSADTSAAIYLDNANSFLEQLNPGSTVSGSLVYDVPVDATLTQVELHDSFLSDGVIVSLN